jgi:hypothetical protein
MSEVLDYFVDAQLNDPNLKAWDGAFSDMPPGEFEFEILSYEKKPTNDGKPRMSLKLKCVTPGEYEGKTVFHGFMLAGEKDTWRNRLLHMVKVLGVPVDSNGGFSFASFVGRRFIAEVVHGTRDVVDATTGLTEKKPTVNIQAERAVGGKPAAGIKLANGHGSSVGPAAA